MMTLRGPFRGAPRKHPRNQERSSPGMRAISVLIVDDELNVREVLRTELAADGFSAVEAGSGAAALAVLQEQDVDAILHHHEHLDGSGYPHGLMGRSIPLLARIIAVADTYDAIVSDRPYRKAGSHEQALAELVRMAGKQFDADVVNIFADVLASDRRPQRAGTGPIRGGAEDVNAVALPR